MPSYTKARAARTASPSGRSGAGPWLRDAAWALAAAAGAVFACLAAGATWPPLSPLALVSWFAVLVCLGALPLLGVRSGAVASALVAGGCLALGMGTVADSLLAVFSLAVGHLCVLALRAARMEADIRAESAAGGHEAARRRALDLQGQGQLEAAFSELVRLPVRGQVLRDLYHLAKAFERGRSFERAREVFAHLAAHAPLYRDVPARLKRAQGLAAAERRAKGLADGGTGEPAHRAPARLGRYEIDGELGRGSMGLVYAAHDPVIGRAVALKTLALGSEFEGAALVDARARFFREAESAGRLQHPHIVAIYDAGDEQGLSWIAMERLHGRDLSHAVQAGTLLPVPTVLSIAARVADALDYAHQHQVVHRDVKPANIVYDPGTDGVKVTDFGIARITDNSKTRTGLVLGTPSFMAPEQIMGTKADGRCDIYALGVTLYQLLTGRLPLRAESMSALMHAIAHEVPADVRSLRAELDVQVALVVARALHKNPAARFQTGAEMAAALRAVHPASQALQNAPLSGLLDYDAGTDFHKPPMADYPDTVLDGAAAPAVRRAARTRI